VYEVIPVLVEETAARRITFLHRAVGEVDKTFVRK